MCLCMYLYVYIYNDRRTVNEKSICIKRNLCVIVAVKVFMNNISPLLYSLLSLVVFYGISTLVGCLMPNLLYKYIIYL